MLNPRPILALIAILPPLAACQPGRTGASSAESHAPGTTTATVAAACGQYPEGAPGVIRTFCNGPAVVKVTMAGVTRTLSGGACSNTGGAFALNLGVIAGPGLAGPKPDYVGLNAPVASGHFANAALTLNLDGKTYALTENSGDVSPTGGDFTAKTPGGEIDATFTC